MAEPINYGMTDADRARMAAEAFANTATTSIADAERQYQSKVNELAGAIVSGMSPQERSVLESQVQDLGNRYSQALAATQNQFAFAQQEAQMTSQEIQRQYQELAARQLGQAAGALGAVSPQYTPGMMTAAQEDAIAAARQQGMADARFITGAQGVSGLAQSLYAQALAGQRAASQAQLQGQQLNLRTALESRALQAAVDREQKERERLREFELAGFTNVNNLRQSYNAKLAELQAAVATADTRTERDKAEAELDQYQAKSQIELERQLELLRAQTAAAQIGQDMRTPEQKAADDLKQYELQKAIDLRNQMKLDRARAALQAANEKPKELTAEQKQVELQAKGQDTKFSQYVQKLLGSKPTTQKKATSIKDFEFEGKFYVSGGQVIRVLPITDPAQKEPTKAAIPLYNINTVINELAGYAQENKPTIQQLATIVNNKLADLASTDRNTFLALQYLLGTAEPGTIAQLILASNPAKVKVGTGNRGDLSGLGYGELGQVYNNMISNIPRQRVNYNAPQPPPVTLSQVRQVAAQPSAALGPGVNTILSQVPIIGNILGLR